MSCLRNTLPLLMACSHFIGGCWAGPIDARFKSPRGFGDTARHTYNRSIHARSAMEPGIWPRSAAPGTNHLTWTVIAVVGVILLICLLAVLVVLARRSKKRLQKSGSDEELGFGQYSRAPPGLALPPRAYDGVPSSQSPPPREMSEDNEHSRNLRKPPPLPLLTVSPPEESGQKPRRVPVPHLPPLPRSPRSIGLPPSPRLIRLPPSPRLPVSPHSQRTNLNTHGVSGPSKDPGMASSPRGLVSPSMGQLSEVPLSAGGLERMMTQMENELRVKEN